MAKITSSTVSDSVRQHARDAYVRPARRQGEKTVAINVGEVHKAVALRNRVPLVCQALESGKFLEANSLRLISKTGPPSGRSTTVTYTYEFVETEQSSVKNEDAWSRLRGALKDVFSELGGGEAYLRAERNQFYPPEKSE
ncbi:MAG TPA: hypothetical protein VH744_00420 [Terriglobales bacterium]|jgi:hypothetical protein